MTAAHVTVIENAPDVPLGSFARHLADAGLAVRTVRAHAGEALPAADDLGAGLVVLGGHGSAYDDVTTPWLPALRALLLDAATTGVPTLAVCLGAQLLAVAGGGQVTVAAPPGREAGAVRIFWRPEAKTDEVVGAAARAAAEVGGRASVYPASHADAVSELPEDAAWLASSNMYPFQAFRLGSALGVQFHPEADAALVGRWLDESGVEDREALVASLADVSERTEANGAELARAFAGQVLASRSESASRPESALV